jgi:hypothetical protein
LAATRSQITPRADDRELQTEQAIVGLPPRKLQPDRMDARSWFGMTFAKESPAWCAMAAVRFRREAVIEQTQTLIGAPPNSTPSTSPLVRVGFGSK